MSINVKVFSQTGRKTDYKTFILRDVNVETIEDVKRFKELILQQFGAEIIDKHLKFDVGYFKGNKKIWIRALEDLTELIHLLLKEKGPTVWCDGVNQSSQTKRPAPSNSEEEIERTQKRKKKKSSFDERLEQVDNIVDDLREINGSKYSSIQYRVWAETIFASRHTDRHNPPAGSFWRGKNVKQSTHPLPSTPPKQLNVRTCITPVKAAELKSTYIKQIKELHSLIEIGAISSDDFKKQRDIILEQMNKLNA